MIHDLDISLDDLHLFYQVVNNGGFLRAAQTMNICQGKASRRIAYLENILGTRLLYRNMRDIALTPAGKKVFKMAQDVLECATQTFTSVKTEQQEMVGEITISISTGFSTFWFIPLLEQFLEQAPELKIDIQNNDLGNVDLAMGEADIVITSHKPNFRENLICETLCEYSFYLHASEKYFQKKGIPSCVQDLDDHDLIGWSGPSFMEPKLINEPLYWGRDPGYPRQARISVQSNSSLMTVTKCGFGLSFIPQFFARSTPEIQRVILQDNEQIPIKKHKKYIVYLKTLTHSQKHVKMIELIKSQALETDF